MSERLGHSSIVIILDTYSHVLPDMQDEAADILNSMIFDPKQDDAEQLLTVN